MGSENAVDVLYIAEDDSSLFESVHVYAQCAWNGMHTVFGNRQLFGKGLLHARGCCQGEGIHHGHPEKQSVPPHRKGKTGSDESQVYAVSVHVGNTGVFPWIRACSFHASVCFQYSLMNNQERLQPPRSKKKREVNRTYYACLDSEE